MKSYIVTIAFVVTLGLLQTLAQVDTARVQPPQPPDPSVPTSTQPQLPQATDYNSTDPLIRIRLDAVPSPMRKNLQRYQSSGWEQSPIYQNSKTNEYMIDIRSGDSIRTFRFDNAGNPVNVNSPTKDF